MDEPPYTEWAYFNLSKEDWELILKARKIEYSIRYNHSNKIDGAFSDKEMFILKCVYNNIFDLNFEIEEIYKGIKSYEISKGNTQQKELLEQHKKIQNLQSKIKIESRNAFIADLLNSKYFWWGLVILILFIWLIQTLK